MAPENSSQMDFGVCYLVKERKPDLSFKLFEIMIMDGTPGLCITRQYPEKIKDQYRYLDFETLWLSHTKGEGRVEPTDISALYKLVEDFIERSEKSVVMLDGLEYLIVNNGFLQILKFMEHLNEKVMQSKAVLIVPVSPNAFDKKELALLERNTEVIESPMVHVDGGGVELFESY